MFRYKKLKTKLCICKEKKDCKTASLSIINKSKHSFFIENPYIEFIRGNKIIAFRLKTEDKIPIELKSGEEKKILININEYLVGEEDVVNSKTIRIVFKDNKGKRFKTNLLGLKKTNGENSLRVVRPGSRAYRPKIILYLISAVISFPIAIILYRYLDFMLVGMPIIRLIIAFAIILIIVRYVVFSVRYLVYIILLGLIGILSVNEISGKYGYKNIFNDYHALILTLNDKAKFPYIKPSEEKTNKYNDIKNAINYKNPYVRNFAVKASTTYFNERNLFYTYGNIIRYFSVYKQIRNSWQYVKDPFGEEYFARASETLEHLAGDCDDYSIIMAACIKAIGGQVRLIAIKGHIYPEVMVGKKEDWYRISYLIKVSLFSDVYNSKPLHGHIDKNDNIWMNFDYTEKYPGGRFFNEEIMEIIELQ